MSEKDENINGDLIKTPSSTDADVPDNQAESRSNSDMASATPFICEQRLHSSSDPIDNDSLWSSPWANLMMVLFAILFLMISLQANQARTISERPTETQKNIGVDTLIINTQKNTVSKPVHTRSSAESSSAEDKVLVLMPLILAEVKQHILSMGSDKIKATILVDHSVRISLSGSILFESDSTKITEQARIFLDKLSVSLKKNRQQIHVIGHTDDQAVDLEQYPDKWALSLIRASTVTRYLIDQGKVEPYKFTIMGRSEYEPLAANLNENARAMNRRVDIIVSKKISRPVETGL